MDWEFYILNYIRQNLTNDFLDKVMPFVSMLGNGVLWVLIAVVCLAVRKTRTFGRTLSVYLVLGLTCCNLILKPIIQRIRPYDLNHTIALIVKAESDYSFPSGHTFFAFGFATVVFMYNKLLGLIAYLAAIVIALSRLYLYVHFPTDVICGAIFGILIALAAYSIDKMLFADSKIENN